DSRPAIVSLKPDRLEDVWSDIHRVADALDAREKGIQLVEALQGRMHDIERRTAALPDRPRVACVEWIEPLMASGNWMPQLVEMAGGSNVFGRAGEHAPGLAWDRLLAADPEYIVVLPCGFDLLRTRQDMPLLGQQSGWDRLQAVRTGKV